MTAQNGKMPEHQRLYLKLRDMILFGELAPGQAVTILGLKDRLNAGMTPAREAIRRLSAEGALEMRQNRRVAVPLMDIDKLEQVYLTRVTVEPELARRACKNRSQALIDDLAAIDAKLNEGIASGDVSTYLEQNYRFHFRLYDAANADILLRLALSLWLQVGPALRIMSGRFGTENLPDKHEEAVQALRDGDPDAVARHIDEDIRQGMDNIRLFLNEPGRGSTN